MNISSWAVGSETTYTTAESVNNIIAKGLSTNGWVTILLHEIDSGNGYSPFSSEELEGVLKYLVENSDIYYVDTFANIARYTKERDATQVTAMMTDNQITATLTCDLDTEIYNVPISVEVPLPDGWTSVTATQNGASIDAEIVGETIIFDAVPSGGEVVITAE